MPTDLALNDEIGQAVKAGQHKTKKEAVTAALKEYIVHRKQQNIIKFFGTIKFADDYDFLSAFEDISLKTNHFEQAAELCNTCCSKGIQGSTIDFLICAVSFGENLVIFTVDKDFANYKKYLPVQLI